MNRGMKVTLYAAIIGMVVLAVLTSQAIGDIQQTNDAKSSTIAALVDDVKALRAQVLANGDVPVAPPPSPEVIASTGERGPKGDPGIDGPRGLTGPGPTGEQVLAAIAAYCSNDNCRGTEGVKGDPGGAGVPGPKGDVGAVGPAGVDGTSIQGPAGPAGADGAAGQPGADGATGATGPQGPPGSPEGVVVNISIDGQPFQCIVTNNTCNLEPVGAD